MVVIRPPNTSNSKKHPHYPHIYSAKYNCFIIFHKNIHLLLGFNKYFISSYQNMSTTRLCHLIKLTFCPVRLSAFQWPAVSLSGMRPPKRKEQSNRKTIGMISSSFLGANKFGDSKTNQKPHKQQKQSNSSNPQILLPSTNPPFSPKHQVSKSKEVSCALPQVNWPPLPHIRSQNHLKTPQKTIEQANQTKIKTPEKNIKNHRTGQTKQRINSVSCLQLNKGPAPPFFGGAWTVLTAMRDLRSLSPSILLRLRR